jgi:hypothetical protein
MIFGKEPLLVLCYQYRIFHQLCQPTTKSGKILPPGAGGRFVVLPGALLEK